MERAVCLDQTREEEKEVEVAQESHSENSVDMEPEMPLETVVNLPVPEGYELTGEKEETERRPGYLVRTVTQTFRRL